MTFTSIKAHEWEDRPDVLRAKVQVLAGIVRKAKNSMVLTGAGISTAAGIDDYATKGRDRGVVVEERPVVKDWKDARPTKAHRVLTAMYRAGHLKHWIQQNHDSLPQKAGFPQHALNEIHGSLHDPANPIVPYEGSLRDDLYSLMETWEKKNDLCLALGTSLSGFNVDRVAETAARRFQSRRSFGLVIVNLQQTQYDECCSLRIFAKIDDVMKLLAKELGIEKEVSSMDARYEPDLEDGAFVEDDVFLVPFDADGNPCEEKMTWDLREGKRVKLTGGPYEGDVGTIMAKNQNGDYRIRFVDSINPMFNAKRRPFSLWLGNWWLEQATKGLGIVPGGKIPFVNVPDATRQVSQQAAYVPPQPLLPKKPANLPAPPPLPKGKGKGSNAGTPVLSMPTQ
jgi:NAD-dependent SIR2 family protein deacetylase